MIYSDFYALEAEKYPGHEDIAHYYLSLLTDEPRWDICIAAKEFASLDGMSSGAEVFPAYGYKFEYPNGSSSDLVAMRCSTIPVSYIYHLVSSNKMKIVLKENEFITDKYSFFLQIVKSVPIPINNDGKFFVLHQKEFGKR